MNQEIVFASGHFGQTDIVELIEVSFSAVKEMDLKLIYKWNEKVQSRNSVYRLGGSSPAR